MNKYLEKIAENFESGPLTIKEKRELQKGRSGYVGKAILSGAAGGFAGQALENLVGRKGGTLGSAGMLVGAGAAAVHSFKRNRYLNSMESDPVKSQYIEQFMGSRYNG